MRTQPIGPFIGINSRLPDFALRRGDARSPEFFLREAENVDIDNAGRIRRREADTLVQAMTGAHSLFEDYIVRDAVVYQVVTFEPYSELFVTVLTSNDKVSWVRQGDDLYLSNGTDIKRLTGGVAYPIGLPTLDAPAYIAIPGTLPAGTYQVGLSYSSSVTGEEGGMSASSNPQVVSGGLRLTMPPATAGATHVNVYLSTTNGSVPFWVGAYTPASVVDITALPATMREANTRFEAPLPAGKLFMSNGRLCSFKGNTVYVGQPFRYGYYDVVAGWIPFLDDVTIAIENQNGTYVAADQTYWIPGDLANVAERIVTVLPYGAVPGTEFRVPFNSKVGWFGAKGFVLGSLTGEVEAPMTENIAFTPPAVGTATVRATRGYYRVTACGWCMNLENKAVTQYTGFEFTSFGSNYGTKADGVYLLNGTAPINAKVGLGKQDFGSEQLKNMPAVYLGVTSDTPMELGVSWPIRDIMQEYTYPARNSGAEVRVQRVDPGKGALANWFDLTVYNRDGSDFTLASVSFAPTASSRRI